MALPCCPHCGSMLMETGSQAEYMALIASQERTHPEYVAMIRWADGQCFPDTDTLQNAYRQAMEE